MAGIGGKLRAIEAHLGDWVKVGEVLYINHEGKYITYAGSRLCLDGTFVYLDENGSATIAGKGVKFQMVEKDVYRLSKEFKRKGNE